MQFGKLIDHAGDEVGLRQPRCALSQLRIDFKRRHVLAYQAFNAPHLVADTAEPFEKGHLVEVVNAARQRLFQILIVKIPRIRQARGQHTLIARAHGLAAVGRFNIRNKDKLVRKPPGFRIVYGEIFLVPAHGGDEHLIRQGEKFFVERAHHHHRPFGEACDLVQQAWIFDKLQPLRLAKPGRIVGDGFLAFIRIKNDFGFLQRRRI